MIGNVLSISPSFLDNALSLPRGSGRLSLPDVRGCHAAGTIGIVRRENKGAMLRRENKT